MPCDLAATGCSPRPGLLACVDQLLAEGTCAREPHAQFSAFAALPPPNDFAALCTDPPFPAGPCTGAAGRTVRMTVDADGNLLIPFDWSGVLFRRTEVPVPRLLDAESMVAASDRLVGVLRVPGPSFLESFSPEGRKLPPLFEQHADMTRPDVFRLFGSADAARTVLRVDRRGQLGVCAVTPRACQADFECPAGERCRRYLACDGGSFAGLPCTGGSDGASECSVGACAATSCTVCAAGPRAGLPCRAPSDCADEAPVGPAAACVPGPDSCADDGDCPGSQCGPALFDFGSRLAAGMGPVQVTDVAAAARDPVPLAGLIQGDDSDRENIFVIDERIKESDLNGDGDAIDPVLTIQDRASGDMPAIGIPLPTGRAAGRAVARIADGGFRFPGAALEGDVVAFLEPETLQGSRDTNGNGQAFESVLRVFRGGEELTGGLPPITADAAPVIDGRSVVISDGLVWFRSAEADLPARRTENLTVNGRVAVVHEPSGLPALSADGRFVAFESDVDNLVPGDTNRVRDVFLRDRVTGDTMRVSVASDGTQADGPSSFFASPSTICRRPLRRLRERCRQPRSRRHQRSHRRLRARPRHRQRPSA